MNRQELTEFRKTVAEICQLEGLDYNDPLSYNAIVLRLCDQLLKTMKD